MAKTKSSSNYRSLQSLVSAFLAGLVLSAIIFFVTVLVIVMQKDTIVPDDKRQIIVACSAIFVVMAILKVLQICYDLYRRYVVKKKELGEEASTVAGV